MSTRALITVQQDLYNVSSTTYIVIWQDGYPERVFPLLAYIVTTLDTDGIMPHTLVKATLTEVAQLQRIADWFYTLRQLPDGFQLFMHRQPTVRE